LKDISEKIDVSVSKAIIQLVQITKKHNIPFFIIVATARDLIFNTIFDIPSPRSTRDIDFGLRLKNWEEFERIKDELIKTDKITQHETIAHRFIFDNKTVIDIIPFGEIENPLGLINWPPDGTVKMTTIGFDEAYRNSGIFQISNNPVCKVKICTPPGLAIMKLISWDQQYPERNKDAKDLFFILSQYINIGNEDRIYSNELDNIKKKISDLDYEFIGPYFLGKDIAMIANFNTLNIITGILNKEVNDNSNYNLISDILRDQFSDNDKYKRTLKLLKYLKMGIDDWKQENNTSITFINPGKS
jgi:predicted nucleotidyltransferase